MTWIVLALRLLPAAAPDGIPIEKGRFAGGPTTVLTLREDQSRSLREGLRTLALTDAQRDASRRSAGRAPATLLVHHTKAGENDCSCDAQDRGLWFIADQLDVPHLYLGEEGPADAAPKDAPPPRPGSFFAWLCVAAGILIALRAAADEVVPMPRDAGNR